MWCMLYHNRENENVKTYLNVQGKTTLTVLLYAALSFDW